MRYYVIRRLVYSFLLAFFAISSIFFIINSLPGNPYDRMRKEMADRNPILFAKIPPSHWARLDALIGLDKPIQVRYVAWLQNMFSGSFGDSWSIEIGSDVLKIVSSRLPYSIILIVTAVLLSLIIALPAGIYSAVRPYTDGDMIITFATFFGIAMPSFWFGILLISIFSGTLHLLPLGGVATRGSPGDIVTVLARVLSLGLTNGHIAGVEGQLFADGLKHLIMPAVTLSVVMTARWSRFIRGAMRDVLHQEYIRTARAKGVPGWKIIIKHALRNALVPVITVIALDVPMLLMGSFMVEIVFAWPGIGRLYVDSFRQNDWPLLMGILVVYTYLLIFANLITDLVYGIIDPRIKFGAVTQS